MFFKQFVLESLGHASYVVGDEKTGSALVVDPRRDVDVYFDALRSQGLRLAYAADTHGHNDYLTGLAELTARQDVELLAFSESGASYHHRDMKDGELIEMGDVAVEVVHTPGHTPEHVSFLVYDRGVGDQPALMLSGGALLVGDIARPDLLGGPEQARAAARTFCHTIQEKILWQLPDDLEVFPTHVAGSLCGANIGSRYSTTVGYERKTNAVLSRVASTEEFVEECIRLDNLPAVPPYWRRMRAQNLAGPELLGVLREPPALHVEEFKTVASEVGVVILDTRSLEAYGGGHVPGAINVGLSNSFATWAGSVLAEDARVLLVLDSPDGLWDATWQLLRIGYDLPLGWLSGGMYAWRKEAEALEDLPQISVVQLREMLAGDDLTVVDVRQPAEWQSGHIPGATFITGAEITQRAGEIEMDKAVAVYCDSGYRSSVAASVLRARGARKVYNILGGMSAWKKAQYPVET
jgi:hydroxyacylglutathione hydrolase